MEARVINTDKYGRFVADVYCNGKHLNALLVEKGLAWHYKYFSKDTTLARLENEAKEKKAGLWNDPDPINPYEWRKGTRHLNKKLKHGAVLICKSPNAKSFHKRMCPGLQKCKSEIIQMDKTQAKKKGYKACGYCYVGEE